MDDKLNYAFLKKTQTLTHFKLNFSVDSYSCFFPNPRTSSVLSLVFAWVLQTAPSLSGSPWQPIIPPQRELLPVSCSLQEFLRAADLCLPCTKRCSWAVSYLSDQAEVSEGPREPLINTPLCQQLLRNSPRNWSAFGRLQQTAQEAFSANIFPRSYNLIDGNTEN